MEYVLCDADDKYLKEALRAARSLFSEPKHILCELHRFDELLADNEQFDFITFTNTAHEIFPHELASVFVSALCRTSPSGSMFLYDMEDLPHFELGAIPWRGDEVETVFTEALKAAGEPEYYPRCCRWKHTSCRGWSLSVNKSFMSVADTELQEARPKMIENTTLAVKEILQNKLRELHMTLDATSDCGCADDQERAQAQRKASDFWAVSRALEIATMSALEQ